MGFFAGLKLCVGRDSGAGRQQVLLRRDNRFLGCGAQAAANGKCRNQGEIMQIAKGFHDGDRWETRIFNNLNYNAEAAK